MTDVAISRVKAYSSEYESRHQEEKGSAELRQGLEAAPGQMPTTWHSHSLPHGWGHTQPHSTHFYQALGRH